LISIGRAFVKNERNCTTCRECIRNTDDYAGFKDKVNLGKKKDRFEFHVESVGMYSPEDIVFQSLQILKEKANKWINIVQEQEEE
jgi:DNA-directed RNA polymerases I and III subunit RPAC1